MPFYVVYVPDDEPFELESDNFEVTDKGDLFLFSYGKTNDEKIGRGYFLSDKWENVISSKL